MVFGGWRRRGRGGALSILGAIVGDIVGSVYEFDNHKSKDFPLFQEDSKFTDDTILTIAIADALMGDRGFSDKYA